MNAAQDQKKLFWILNFVDDAVVSDSNSIGVVVSFEFFNAVGARVIRKEAKGSPQTIALLFGEVV